MASAKARKQYCSIPARWLAISDSFMETSISGAPPPAISALPEVTVGSQDFVTEFSSVKYELNIDKRNGW